MEDNEPSDFMKIHDEIHAFMAAKPRPDDASKLPYIIQRKGVDFTTQLAATYARPDLLIPLVENHGADIHRPTSILYSDRHRGQKVVRNLIDEVLTHHLYAPDADRSAQGRERVVQTVKFLLQNGVSAMLNPDGMENSVLDAYRLAHPDRTRDERAPEFDWVIACSLDDDIQPPFLEPLALIQEHQPEAVELFEKSRAIEGDRLCTEFSRKAANAQGENKGPMERIWDGVTHALGWGPKS